MHNYIQTVTYNSVCVCLCFRLLNNFRKSSPVTWASAHTYTHTHLYSHSPCTVCREKKQKKSTPKVCVLIQSYEPLATYFPIKNRYLFFCDRTIAAIQKEIGGWECINESETMRRTDESERIKHERSTEVFQRNCSYDRTKSNKFVAQSDGVFVKKANQQH